LTSLNEGKNGIEPRLYPEHSGPPEKKEDHQKTNRTSKRQEPEKDPSFEPQQPSLPSSGPTGERENSGESGSKEANLYRSIGSYMDLLPGVSSEDYV